MIAPVMVYSWPTKELLAKHKLETGLSIRPQYPSRSSVYSAAADALVHMLKMTQSLVRKAEDRSVVLIELPH